MGRAHGRYLHAGHCWEQSRQHKHITPDPLEAHLAKTAMAARSPIPVGKRLDMNTCRLRSAPLTDNYAVQPASQSLSRTWRSTLHLLHGHHVGA